jgi:hypothetical protein
VFEQPQSWTDNWLWGAPIIVFTVVAHAFGLAFIHEYGVGQLATRLQMRRTATIFAVIVATTALLLTVLLGAEAAVWAAAYFTLGALADARSAMLFSLNAMTTYGHDQLGLAPHWRLMGALEALNGVILFGLTTAYLFAVLQLHWPTHARKPPPGLPKPPAA